MSRNNPVGAATSLWRAAGGRRANTFRVDCVVVEPNTTNINVNKRSRTEGLNEC